MTIHRALLVRAVVMWPLLRLMVLAVMLAESSVSGSPLDAASLFTSFAPIPFVLVLSGLLSEVDVRRRHESALLGNLGIARKERLAVAIGVAAAGELALATVLSMLFT